MRLFALFAAACLLASCTTYGDLREKSVAKDEIVKADTTVLVDCTFDKFQQNYSYGSDKNLFFQRTKSGNETHIAAQINGFFGPQFYEWDLAFIPIDAGTTRVELRSKTTVWGGLIAPDEIWDDVRGCGTPEKGKPQQEIINTLAF